MPGKDALERKREKQRREKSGEPSKGRVPTGAVVAATNQEEKTLLEVASAKEPLEIQEEPIPKRVDIVDSSPEDEVPLEVASAKAPLKIQEESVPETVDLAENPLEEEVLSEVASVGVTSEATKAITAGPAIRLNGELRCPDHSDASAVAIESIKVIYCAKCNQFWSYPDSFRSRGRRWRKFFGVPR